MQEGPPNGPRPPAPPQEEAVVVEGPSTSPQLIGLTDTLEYYTQQVDNAASQSALIYSKLATVKAHVREATTAPCRPDLLGLQIEVDSLLASLSDHLPATVRGTDALAEEVMALRQRRDELRARVQPRTVRNAHVAVDVLRVVTWRLQNVREELAKVEDPLGSVVCRLENEEEGLQRIAEQVCDQRDHNFMGPLAVLAKQMDELSKRALPGTSLDLSGPRWT